MRVLVTGHLDTSAPVVVPMLLSAGHEVAGLDSDLYAACSFGDGLVDVPTIRKDIRDVELGDLRGFEAIVHLAALARRAGVSRFVFSSSCSVYGAAGDLFVTDLAAQREIVHNEAFNVGLTEENYRIRDLAEIVRDTVPGSTIEYADGGGPDPRCYRVDFGKIARTLPAFTPKWNARDGAREIHDAYRRVGLALDDCEGPRFKRIDHLRLLVSSGRLDPTLRWVEGAA